MSDHQEPSLDAVLDHGGWLLIDPRPVAAAHPDTFEMPTREELDGLGRGSGVKAMFTLADLSDPVRDGRPAYSSAGVPQLTLVTERMWLQVLGRDGDLLRCVLDNVPFSTHTRLVVNARIDIPVSHVIATDPDGSGGLDDYLAELERSDLPPVAEHSLTRPEDATRWPSVRPDQDEICRRAGVWPHPPWPFGQMLVAKDLSPDAAPVHGARFAAEPERGDCGWVVFAGYGSMDEAHEAVGFEVVTVQEACRRQPRLLAYLALPEAWGFTFGPDGDDVYLADITD
ncbi:hypothetical protein LL946_06975 [Knoellia locipacati]|uniref:immunity protein Imm33 domain-containing protein n=1 Tax=Knoellia locipacati TaxID=882824 RepID=UPI00384EB540